jgi:4-hydroxy-tetrahydrodipicolinate synthase
MFTGINITPDVVARLAEHPNIVGLKESNADLVVLGWAPELSDDRASVVRAVLERSKIPVMLIPVSVRGGDDDRP